MASDAVARAGWASPRNDPHCHWFGMNLAYPVCRAWLDWGSPRDPTPDRTPCPECVAELREHLSYLEWWRDLDN